MKEFQKTKENIIQGKNTTEEIFKLGFTACIESIHDKRYEDLVKILRKEHSKL